MKKYNVIILADGEKGPFSNDKGALHKARVPIHGKPMIDWVIDAFHACEHIDNIVVVGPADLEQCASMRYIRKRISPGLNIAQNIIMAVAFIKQAIYKNAKDHNGYLISFCDAVFLTTDIINETLINIEKSDGDLVFHFVEKQSFVKEGHKGKRTYFPVNGKFYAGTTIYYLKRLGLIANVANKLIDLHFHRKNPAKILELINCEEKTLPCIEQALSSQLSGTVKIFISPHTRLALNVNKKYDLEIATQMLSNPWRHSYKKAMLIYNPNAGQGQPLSPLFQEILGIRQKKFEVYNTKEDYAKQIQIYLKEYGINAEITGTEYKGHATELARQCVKDGYDLVIAAGGDGTINEVVNGLVDSPVTLGVIPLGTANVLGIQLNIPREIRGACQLIASGKQTNIDLGKIKDRYFIIVAGVGFDAHVLHKTDSKLKKIYGALAYVFVAFTQILVYPFKKISIKIDDQPIPRTGYFVLIGNGKYYGGELIVATQADISDGYLDVCIFKYKNIFSIISYIFGMRFGNLDKNMSIEYFQCKKIQVLKSGRHAVHVDAEYLCKSPVEITVCPGAITIAG